MWYNPDLKSAYFFVPGLVGLLIMFLIPVATASAKESARRGYETSLRENQYWLRRLQSAHMFNTEPDEVLTRAQRIDAVTPAGVQDVFKKYFPLDRYTVVTLMPAPTP